MKMVLALDVGSSSVRAQRFDERGNPDGDLRQEKYDGRDPKEILRLARIVLDGEEPDGTSCFGHSPLALGEDGGPLTEGPGWRDTRGAAAAEGLCRRPHPRARPAPPGRDPPPPFRPAKPPRA